MVCILVFTPCILRCQRWEIFDMNKILLSFMLALYNTSIQYIVYSIILVYSIQYIQYTISLSIRAPSKRGNYWEIHRRCPRDFSRVERNLDGNLPIVPEFCGVQSHSLHHQSFHRECIRKSFPIDREGLTVLNPILPCIR